MGVTETKDALRVTRGPRSGGGIGAQKKRVRHDGWTQERISIFMETLAHTCNVSEAARQAGKSLTSAYEQQRRDPGFARAWEQALDMAYDELETLLLRQALFGTEQEEIVLDGEGAVKGRKVKRAVPLAVGLRLLLAHRKEVLESRAARTGERPDGEDAVARIHAVMAEVRRKRGLAGSG